MRKRLNRYSEELERLAGMNGGAGRSDSTKETDCLRESTEELEEEGVFLLPYEPNPHEAKDTLYDLYTGILAFSILFLTGGLFFFENKLSYFLGILIGGLMAAYLSFHMYQSLDLALDLPSSEAVKYIRKRTGLRMVFMGMAVLCACFFPEYIHLAGVVFGLLSLKAAAFVQPVIHKFTTKILHKGR